MPTLRLNYLISLNVSHNLNFGPKGVKYLKNSNLNYLKILKANWCGIKDDGAF